MTPRLATALLYLLISAANTAMAADPACGTLESAASASGEFALKEGTAVDLVRDGRRVHGTLHIYRDDTVYRVYWQPEGSPEPYVLATAGENSVRLVATPPRGSPVGQGPGVLPRQQVLSCPSL
jgi:hypothetical protein